MPGPARPPPLPQELVQAIRDGDCVAFVGAGFTAAANLPSWQELLRRIASHAPLDLNARAYVGKVIDAGASTDLEQAAQVLEDLLGPGFNDALRSAMGEPLLSEAMRLRMDRLAGIPFRAVLTTNFDGILAGPTREPDGFRDVLRTPHHAWWSTKHWHEAPGRQPIVLKLHGDLHSGQRVVLTRQGYREMLHGGTAYGSFLRAVMATRTFLYLGFSFTDTYLNEIRSEILHMLGNVGERRCIGYAVMADVPDFRGHYMQDHEGIRVINYTTEGGDHSGFDAILEQLHAETNPQRHLRTLLTDKRILWLDPHPENNAWERSVLEQASDSDANGCRFRAALSVAEAMAELGRAAGGGQAYDLVITHWGQQGETVHAEELLRAIRSAGTAVDVPVLVYGGNQQAAQRKRRALRLGAVGYCFAAEELLRKIEDVFAAPEGAT